MRYPASEKLEIIRLVEQSHLGVGSTLDKLGIPKTTFYRWYDRFLAFGDAGLEDRNSSPVRTIPAATGSCGSISRPHEPADQIIQPAVNGLSTTVSSANRLSGSVLLVLNFAFQRPRRASASASR